MSIEDIPYYRMNIFIPRKQSRNIFKVNLTRHLNIIQGNRPEAFFLSCLFFKNIFKKCFSFNFFYNG